MKNLVLKLYRSQLAKETFSYTFINVLNKSIPFLLLPVYSRLLSKEGMGSYLVFQALFQVMIPILTLALQYSVNINYYHLNEKDFKKYFSAVFYLLIVVFFFTGSGTFLLNGFIAQKAEVTSDVIYLIVPIIFFNYNCNLRQNLWRVKRQPLFYGRFTVISTFFQNSLGFVFVIFFDTGWIGILYGNLLGNLIMGMYAIFTFYKEGLLVFNRIAIAHYAKDAFKISIPLSLHTLSAWLGTTVNRLIIANKMGVKFTASYGIGSTFFMICDVLFDALNNAYIPAINEKLRDSTKEALEKLKRLTFYYYYIIIGITAVFSTLGYFSVGLLFGTTYENTKQFIIPTTLAAGFNGLYKIHANKIFFTKKTWIVTCITFSAAIINIPLSIGMIINFKLLGAAYSLLFINIYYYLIALLVSTFYKGTRFRYEIN